MEPHEEVPTQTTHPNLSPEEQDLVAELVADGLSIQERFRPEPVYRQTGQGHDGGRSDPPDLNPSSPTRLPTPKLSQKT